MEKILDQDDVRRIIQANFVLAHLDPGERDADKTFLENPGAVDLLNKIGEDDSTVPFTAFCDASGILLDTSLQMGDRGTRNLGCPSNAEEAEEYVAKLRKWAPRITDAEASALTKALTPPSQKQKGEGIGAPRR